MAKGYRIEVNGDNCELVLFEENGEEVRDLASIHLTKEKAKELGCKLIDISKGEY